jgi:hypothetical protein
MEMGIGESSMLGKEKTLTQEWIMNSYLSFFTNLCYIGMIAYFFASGVQTLSYAVR